MTAVTRRSVTLSNCSRSPAPPPSQFLQLNNLTDFSLLIGVHDTAVEQPAVPRGSAENAASPGDGLGDIISQGRLVAQQNPIEMGYFLGRSPETNENLSGGDEDEEEDGGLLSDNGGACVPLNGLLSWCCVCVCAYCRWEMVSWFER